MKEGWSDRQTGGYGLTWQEEGRHEETKPERGGELELRKPGTEIESAKEPVIHIQRGGGKYLSLFALQREKWRKHNFGSLEETTKERQRDREGMTID